MCGMYTCCVCDVWLNMVMYRILWLCMVFYGYAWCFMVMYVLCMVMQICMVMYVHIYEYVCVSVHDTTVVSTIAVMRYKYHQSGLVSFRTFHVYVCV